jgi:hypothetical protein
MSMAAVLMLAAAWFMFGIMSIIAITFSRRSRKLDRMIREFRAGDY